MADEIKPNSHAYKEQKPKNNKEHVEKVVQGNVTRKRRSLMRQAEEAVLSEDANTVKEYLFWDVFIPALKDVIVDMGKKALDAIFYGDRRTNSSSFLERDRGSTYVRYDKASYENRYNSRYSSPKRERVAPYNRRALHNFDDITFDSRIDAENVLDALVQHTMDYGIVTIAHFYDYLGMETKYTDWDWGWYELSGAHVDRVRNKYVIVLPRPVIIDDEDKVPW